MRSSVLVFGNLLDESILWTSKGTMPVPSFSTKRWLRKSSSLERSRICITLVGRHVSVLDEERDVDEEDGGAIVAVPKETGRDGGG